MKITTNRKWNTAFKTQGDTFFLRKNTKLGSCENTIKLTDIPTRKRKTFQSNCVRQRKEKVGKASKISKTVISENKVEEVVIDNIDYEDVVQFEALGNFCKDPVNNNIK